LERGYPAVTVWLVDDITPLALAAARGDEIALERMVTLSYGDVRRLCAILVDEGSADDLAQETFSRVLRGLRRYRGDASARTWLLAIARNVCADELRGRTRRRRRDHELTEIASMPPPAADHAVRLEIIDLISRLAPERREAFVLTQLLALSYDEAASVCGCPRGTVHSRVARARDDLISMSAAAQQTADGSIKAGFSGWAQDISDS
jgi:RNA polymerase sigma-70 factor (ECF subfamily)